MDFLTLAKERYSCRYFDKERPVEQEKIDKINPSESGNQH